jgi:hypothetical protein
MVIEEVCFLSILAYQNQGIKTYLQSDPIRIYFSFQQSEIYHIN